MMDKVDLTHAIGALRSVENFLRGFEKVGEVIRAAAASEKLIQEADRLTAEATARRDQAWSERDTAIAESVAARTNSVAEVERAKAEARMARVILQADERKIGEEFRVARKREQGEIEARLIARRKDLSDLEQQIAEATARLQTINADLTALRSKLT